MTQETAGYLPGFAPIPQKTGQVETAYIEQMDNLAQLGVMGPEHAGLRALVIRAARAVDEITANDAASGRAALLKTLNDVAARLPEPKKTEASVIDQLLAIFDVDDGGQQAPYDNIRTAS